MALLLGIFLWAIPAGAQPAPPRAVLVSPEKVLFFETYGFYLPQGVARFAIEVTAEDARKALESLGVKVVDSVSRFNLWKFSFAPERGVLDTLARVAGLEKILYVLPLTDLPAVAKATSSKNPPMELPGKMGVKFDKFRVSTNASAIDALAKEAGAVVEWSPRDSTVMLRFPPVPGRNAAVLARLKASGEVYKAEADWVRNGHGAGGDPGADEDYDPDDDHHGRYHRGRRHYHHDYDD